MTSTPAGRPIAAARVTLSRGRATPKSPCRLEIPKSGDAFRAKFWSTCTKKRPAKNLSRETNQTKAPASANEFGGTIRRQRETSRRLEEQLVLDYGSQPSAHACGQCLPMFSDIGSPPLPPAGVRDLVADVSGGWEGGSSILTARRMASFYYRGRRLQSRGPPSVGWCAQCGNLWTIGRWLPLLMITHSGVRPTGHPSLDVAPGKTASSLGPNATEGFRPQGRPTAAEVHPGELRWGKWMGTAGSARCVLIDRERHAEVPGDCRREVILPLPVQ